MNSTEIKISIFYVQKNKKKKNIRHSLLTVELPATMLVDDVEISQERPDGDVALFSTLPKGPGVSVLSVGERKLAAVLQTLKVFPSQ